MTQNFSERDKMDREKVVDNIMNIIKNMPTKYDSTRDDKPIKNATIALNGEWGSGKSFVMNMLRERLEAVPEYIVVNYDAWKNNFYSDPLIAMLYCIIDDLDYYSEIMPRDNKIDKKEVIKKIKKELIKKGSESKKFLVRNLSKALSIWVNVINNIESSPKDNNNFDDFRSYQSLLNDIKEMLNTLTNPPDGEERKLIILVDEIDRCLPNEQLLVLERLHHLFDVGNCAVVVAINKNAVIQTYEKQFCIPKDNENPLLAHIDGEIYLRKFFDRNIDLQRGELVYLDKLLEVFVDSYIPNCSWKKEYFEEAVKQFIQNEQCRGCEFSARDADRFVNNLCNIMNREHKEIEIFFLIAMCFCKLYDKKKYLEYYKGNFNINCKFINIDELLNVNKNSINNSTKKEYTYHNNSKKSEVAEYCIYVRKSYVEIQYYFNYCLFRKDKERIKSLNDIINDTKFKEFVLRDKTWIDECFQIIDKYIV